MTTEQGKPPAARAWPAISSYLDECHGQIIELTKERDWLTAERGRFRSAWLNARYRAEGFGARYRYERKLCRDADVRGSKAIRAQLAAEADRDRLTRKLAATVRVRNDAIEALDTTQIDRDRLAAQQVVADDAWGSVWLHGKWDWLTKQMTTEQREYAADCVARWSARLAEDDGDEERGEPEGLRWWREAA